MAFDVVWNIFRKRYIFHFRVEEEWYTGDRLVELACTVEAQEEEGYIVIDGHHTEFMQIDRREFTDHDTKKQNICRSEQSLQNNQC